MINPAFHSMLVHLLMGTMFLFSLAFAAKIYLDKRNPGLGASLKKELDFVFLFSGAAGFIILVITIISGFIIMPLMAMLNSGIMKNKITLSFIMLVFIAAFIVARYLYRQSIQENRPLYIFTALLGVLAFVFGIMASSIGGELTNRSSGFENIVKFLPVNTRWTFYLPLSLLLVVVFLGVLSIFIGYRYRKES